MPEVVHLPPTKTPPKSSTEKIDSTMEATSASESKDKSEIVNEDKSDSVKSMKIPKMKKAKLFKQKISMSLDPTLGVNEKPDVVMLDGSGDKGERDPQLRQQKEENYMKLDATKHSGETTSSSIDATTSSASAPSNLLPEDDKNTESKATTTLPPTQKKKKISTKESTVKPTATKEDLHATAWTSCYSVAFNKNGTYLASGHASGLIPVHSFASRCLNAVYSPPTSTRVKVAGKGTRPIKHVNGTTSLAWDNTGKFLLAGAYGDKILRWMDNSHPSVAWECAEATRRATLLDQSNGGGSKNSAISVGQREVDLSDKIQDECDAELTRDVSLQQRNSDARTYFQLKVISAGKGRLLESRTDSRISSISNLPSQQQQELRTTVPCIRHPYILFQLPQPLGGACQLHPAHNDIGMARLMDSSLVLFHVPPMAFYEMMPYGAASSAGVELRHLLEKEEANRAGNILYPVPSVSDKRGDSTSTKHYSVNCAAFGKGKHENRLYAITKCGSLLEFEITPIMIEILRGKRKESRGTDIQPVFSAKIPYGASAIQMVINEKHILVNSSDALRLYNVNELRSNATVTPDFVFQDPVSKAPWVSCDFSADGEYIVGGKNEDNYTLFLWNAVTGELIDQLTGPQVSLYSMTCHPTRPFIAVGSSDGMVSRDDTCFELNSICLSFYLKVFAVSRSSPTIDRYVGLQD